jgi:diacylglycerol O-acyltransferase / wax synthase
MMDRMSGTDALLWHMEGPDTPMHTLKVAVADPIPRGRPIDLAELRDAMALATSIVPCLTTRPAWAPGFAARPYWVDDTDFDLDRHLDERTAPTTEDLTGLDEICSRLAEEHLPHDRPLWSATLVHGLPGGRQAIVVRVHHAMVDGLAALNGFLAATGAAPGELPEVPPARLPRPATTGRLARAALADLPRLVAGAPRLARDGLRSRRAAARYRATAREVPAFIGARRNFANAPSGARRTCATASWDLGDLRLISQASGATINGVLHAVIAGAMRAELLARGEDASEPTVAAFGVAVNGKDGARLLGNAITPTNVFLRSDLADPVDRLDATARSCVQGVGLRQATGLEMAGRWSDYGPRLAPLFRRVFAERLPRTVNHVTTANVRGPARTRWFGDLEIVDWYSFALAVAPSNLNITVYSYAGRLNLGLVTTPEVLPEPHRFLTLLAQELALLTRAVAGEQADQEREQEQAIPA